MGSASLKAPNKEMVSSSEKLHKGGRESQEKILPPYSLHPLQSVASLMNSKLVNPKLDCTAGKRRALR